MHATNKIRELNIKTGGERKMMGDEVLWLVHVEQDRSIRGGKMQSCAGPSSVENLRIQPKLWPSLSTAVQCM